jgi:hypothetical protein
MLTATYMCRPTGARCVRIFLGGGCNSDVRATRVFAPGRVFWYILANTIRTMSVTIIIDKHIDSKHSRTYMSLLWTWTTFFRHVFKYSNSFFDWSVVKWKWKRKLWTGEDIPKNAPWCKDSRSPDIGITPSPQHFLNSLLTYLFAIKFLYYFISFYLF